MESLFMSKISNLLSMLAVAAALASSPVLAAEPAASTAKPKARTDLFPDTTVAKGKGFEIKRSELDDEVIRLKAQAAARGRTVSPEESTAIEKQVLDQLIQIQLLQAKATEAERAAAKETAEKRLKDAQTQLGSEDAFNRRLKTEGVTRDQLLEKWTAAAACETAAKRELSVKVSDDDAKKYYEDNPARFESPEMVRVSHILFSIQDPNDTNPDPALKKEIPEEQKRAKRKKAEEILKRARDGDDFTKLAREFSEDPSVKINNGEYKFGRDDLFVPEFKAAAFSLNTNQVSDIVPTLFGYHIIKQWEKIPARKEPFSGPDTKATLRNSTTGQYFTASIKEILADEGLRKQLPDFMRKLKKDAGVEILDEKLKADETADISPAAPTASAK